jgi:FtsZ-binding cell division protein ZapB
MALPNKEKYEQKKVDNLLQYLRLYHDKGQPIDYEILVDGFKAVRRTSDPDMFSMFENFVTADTRSIEILLFTGSSNNNEKRIFYFGEEPKEGLSGVEVKSMVDDEVQRKLREKEYETLMEENKKLQQHIADLESEVDELEKQNAQLEMKQSPLNSFLGDVGSSLVESFIKRNPKLMSAFPGGEALAGLLQSDNSESGEETTPESEVSFKPKPVSNQTTTLSESDLSAGVLTQADEAAIQFVNQLKSQFNKEEFDSVLIILQTLADDKTKIDLILNHVNTVSAKSR